MEHPHFDTDTSIFDAGTTLSIVASENIINLSSLPEMEIMDGEQTGWNFFKDSETDYMKAVMRFAETWARYMQLGIESGETIEEVWSEGARFAYPDDLSTSMQYYAARILARHWVYGKELTVLLNKYCETIGKVREDEQNRLLDAHIY